MHLSVSYLLCLDAVLKYIAIRMSCNGMHIGTVEITSCKSNNSQMNSK